jgi:hypothetical protein
MRAAWRVFRLRCASLKMTNLWGVEESRFVAALKMTNLWRAGESRSFAALKDDKFVRSERWGVAR